MSGPATSAGATLSIGTTATNASTDTYTLIGSVTNIPEFGTAYKEITFAPLGQRDVKKFKGSRDAGSITVELGRDVSDAGQAACVTALGTDFDYNFKLLLNDAVASVSSTVTMTIAAPGVVTWTAHGLPAGTPIKLSTTGALPTGLVAGTTYYIVAPATDTFELAATSGGSPITTTGTQSGVHTGTTVPVATNQLLKAKVMSFTTIVGTIDQVTAAKMMLGITTGSIVETVHLP